MARGVSKDLCTCCMNKREASADDRHPFLRNPSLYIVHNMRLLQRFYSHGMVEQYYRGTRLTPAIGHT